MSRSAQAANDGFALIGVLLLLVTLTLLGLAVQLLALFNLQLARNGTQALAARLETAGQLTHSLLILEQVAAGGTLPADAPQLPGHTQYQLLTAGQALLLTVSSERPGISSEALVGMVDGSFQVLGRR
jgi:hypothetical protein